MTEWPSLQGNLDAHVATLARKATRVLDEVHEDLVERVCIAHDVRSLAHHGEVHAALLDKSLHEQGAVIGNGTQVDARELHVLTLGPLQGEQVIGQAREAVALLDDLVEKALLQLLGNIPLEQGLGRTANGGERRTDFVAYVTHELRLRASSLRTR